MKNTATKFKETEIGLIPEEWGIFRLGDVVEKVVDNRGKTPPLAQNGYELLEVNSIKANHRSPDYSEIEKFVDEVTYKNWFRTGHILRNDLVIPTVGTIGNLAISLEDRGSIAQNLIALRLSGDMNPNFVYYLLSSTSYKEKLLNLDIGGVQPSIKVPHLLNLEIFAPKLTEQKQIAEILSSLDDKIELNQKINANLENLTAALFKKWFVDIGDELPEGWKIAKFTDVVDILSGGTPKTSDDQYWGGNIPFFTPKDVSDSAYTFRTDKYITRDGLENCNSLLYPINTTFITARGTVGKVAMAGIPMSMNQSCYALRGKGDLGPYFVYELTRRTAEELKQKAHGSVFSTITMSTFSQATFLLSDSDLIHEYELAVKPFFEKIRANCQENMKLISLRDSLAPRLMSGKIRV